MSHTKFLEQIADYYTDNSRINSLADYTFIFPNKRSAHFLKHYIHKRVKDDFVFMPRFTTFTRFASYVSKTPEAQKFELLFILFNAYIDVLKKINPDAETPSFDKFIFWGDMIIDDFDVIDSSLADAEKLYSNLKGLKEITSDYLTKEQKEVIERIWGPTNLTQHIDKFWHHIDYGNKEDMARKFIAMWEVMSPLYKLFRDRLENAGLGTTGMQLRKAADIIKNTSLDELSRHHYVFVGQADISHAEFVIMDRMKSAGCADFFWDLGSPVFHNDGNIDESNITVRFISRLANQFPMPEDFSLQPIEGLGQIDIVGVPSSVMQTKYVGSLIGDLKLDKETALDTAIVVPDASQLMSLMLSLPKQEHGINITLQLPYSSTTFSALFSAIITMQRRSRKSAGRPRTFFFQDVLEVLLNPYIQLIAGKEAAIIRQYIYDKNLFNIDSAALVEHFPDTAFIFNPINEEKDDYLFNLDDSSRYVETLIKTFRKRFSFLTGYKKSFEVKILEYFEKQVENLKNLIKKHSVEMKELTFLSLFERIMLSKSISMEGTPLKGLQVMGVLETRCLDFDTIIFMAMNEQSLPRREYVKTMIPNSLRRGYGLPTIEHTESFYSYYFFRAISRASHVTLVYDTRSPGRGRGEMSRYLEQLLYIHNKGNISHKIIELSGSVAPEREFEVKKTPEIMAQLAEYKKPNSGKRISASALKTFMKCPLEFYLKYVNGLGEDNEPTDYIDAAALGDIFHRTAKRIYDKYVNAPITAEVIDGIIKNKEIDDALLKETAVTLGLDPEKAGYDDISSEGRLLMANIRPELELMLRAEKSNYCADGASFDYVAGELKVSDVQWTVGEHSFNILMFIDRVDRLNDGTLRFIDYKTGLDEQKFKNVEDLFKGNHKVDGIFQLLMYAATYDDIVAKAISSGQDEMWLKKTGVPKDITYSLYVIRNLMKTGILEPIVMGNSPVPAISKIKEEFYPLMKDLIDRIFNETEPFRQCEDVKRCRFCNFKSLCGRNVPVENYY